MDENQKELNFVIIGDPVGKGRPRFTIKGGHVKTYTPKKTADYEKLVQKEYIQASLKKFSKILNLGNDSAISVEINAYFKIPKNTNKKCRLKMLDCILRPLKKCDSDNIGKIICDSLNGIAYGDDKQVVDLHIKKWYAEEPRVNVVVKNIKGENLNGKSNCN